jgi:signal transduction histidine kinase
LPSTIEAQLEEGTSAFRFDRDRFLRGVVEGMRCGILAVDRDGHVVLANELARQILELESSPRPGAAVDEALHPHLQLARALKDSFSMASLPNRAELELRTPSGRIKTVGFTLSFVPDADGRPAGAAVFFKDLTHVEHREEQERLKDRLAALGEMAANLAHEIRNPLAGIEVSCGLLKRRLSPEDPGREILDKVLGEVRRLDRTITSSLEFARPLTLSLSAGAIEPLLDDALHAVRLRRGEAKVRVERKFNAAGSTVRMDRGQLRQVFENLFLNAFQAMDDEGVLTIETDTALAPPAPQTPYRPPGAVATDPWAGFDKYLVVRVSDTGPGVSVEDQDKLFYPFFTTKKHGSGVGLSMARKIVDSHRGLIDFQNRPGRGVTFTVRLPLIGTGAEERS